MGIIFEHDHCIRVQTTIHQEKNLYVLITAKECIAKFAYENRPENEKLREIINAVCDAVTLGLQKLDSRGQSDTSK